ncbi:MAG: choline kinase [Bradymonadia bacterium]
MTTGRTGVILAAGFGSRLREANPTAVKPLTIVAGRPLLVGAVANLRAAGCDAVVVVLGDHADDIEAAYRDVSPDDDIIFARNPRFALSNGLSVLAAEPHVHGEFALTMADHVYGEEVLALAKSHVAPEGGAILFVDRNIDGVFDLDDATKVRTRDGDRIDAIGKALETYDAIDTGLFLCTPKLFEALKLQEERTGDASLSEGIAVLTELGTMRVVDIEGGRWQDVDTPEMLAEARKRFG